MQVQSLGQEDPLEEGMATHSVFLPGEFHGRSVSSVQFSHPVVSDSLRPHESQHARPPCPSPTPRVYPNPCPSSWWCHPAISSSAVPFSSCPQSFPALGSFPMSNSLHEVAKVLEIQLQHQSFQRTPRKIVVGDSPSGCKELDTTEVTHHACMQNASLKSIRWLQ